MAQAHILMCPPDFFGIEYEINPWMKRECPAEHALAVRQWSNLKDVLESLGAKVSLMRPEPGLPDLVFTANAALVFRQRAILSRFLHPQRQGEEPHNQKWLEEHGFLVEQLGPNQFFEGAGDALFCGDTLFAGYRRRSDVNAHQQVAKRLDCRVIPMELVDAYYYHLDTCFCPLEPGKAIYFPGAFDEYGRRAIAEHIPQLIAVEEEEARSFACNAVVVGRTVVTNTGCPRLHADLKRHGFATEAVALSEFVKAGGSAKCLTLRLDGEEAAAWKTSR